MENNDTMKRQGRGVHEADRRHLERLSAGLAADFHAWRHRRRLAQHAVASLLVLLMPAALFMALPQRVDDRRVLCNQQGSEEMVVARACEGLGGGHSCMECNNPAGGGIL